MYFKMKISVIIKIRCLFTMCISKFLTFSICIYSPNNNFTSEVKECFLGEERAITQSYHKRAPTHKVYQNLNITGFKSQQVRSSLILISGLPNNCPGLIRTGLWQWQKLLKNTRDSSSVIQKARHWMVELLHSTAKISCNWILLVRYVYSQISKEIESPQIWDTPWSFIWLFSKYLLLSSYLTRTMTGFKF